MISLRLPLPPTFLLGFYLGFPISVILGTPPDRAFYGVIVFSAGVLIGVAWKMARP